MSPDLSHDRPAVLPSNAMAATPKKKLTKQHLDNLAAGRTEAAIVNRYLTAMEQPRKRGRQVDASPEKIAAQKKLVEASTGTTKLAAMQRLLDLEGKASAKPAPVDIGKLEADFIRVAADYSERKGISVAAWRKIGVSPEVLKKAKIT